MDRKIIIFIFVLTVFFQPMMNGTAKESTQDDNTHVVAYYFHGNFRCPTCRKLEQYAKEAIENNFKSELAKGTLVFKAVNVEEKGKEHFVNDYQLYSKSLVLSLVKDKKEIKHKNLTKIWDHVRNKKKYIDYVKNEIKIFLGEIK